MRWEFRPAPRYDQASRAVALAHLSIGVGRDPYRHRKGFRAETQEEALWVARGIWHRLNRSQRRLRMSRRIV
jgi:hypothetical protein